MEFKLTLVLVVVFFANHHEGHVEAVTGVEAMTMINTVIEGADKLAAVLEKVDEIMFKPIIEYVDREIKQINFEIEGITAEEKEKVRDALTKLALGKNNIMRVRAVLKVLADETISRSSSLKMILKKLLVKKTGEDQYKGVKILAKRMSQVLGRSKDLLGEALLEYKRINNEIAVVSVDLEIFKKGVIRLADNKSKEHIEAVKSIRIKAYVGALGGAALGGAGLIISYPVAAGIAESKIKEWRAKINRLSNLCKDTAGNVDDALKKIGDVTQGLKKEESIVRSWESRVIEMAYEFENTDEYIEYIDWDDDLKKEQIDKLDKLIQICMKFKEHADSIDL